MSKTGIPYCDLSLNVVVGCTPVSGVGSPCLNCWSKELHDMRHSAYCRNPYNGLPKQYAKPFNEIQLFPERLKELKHLKKPRTIFICSGSDLFHPDVPDEFIDKIFEAMISYSQHTYLILTKKVKKLAGWLKDFESGKRIPHQFYTDRIRLPDKILTHPSGFPPYKLPNNIILGISIWNQESADRDIPILLDCWKGKTWISAEPLLGDINLKKYLTNGNDGIECGYENTNESQAGRRKVDTSCSGRSISFCIIGCESGSHRRPCKNEWLDSIAEQCKAANHKRIFSGDKQ